MNKNLKNRSLINSPNKGKNSLISATTASFGAGLKKTNNLDQNQYNSVTGTNEKKRGSSSVNSGTYSFSGKKNNHDKKSEISKSEYVYSSNNQITGSSKEIKNSNKSDGIKRNTQVRNSVITVSSQKENKRRNKLGNIQKIRIKFIRKLTKKIEKLKTKKKKYKYLSKSLSHDLKKYTKQGKNSIDNSIIKNLLDDEQNKNIINNVDKKKEIHIISTQNNIINNVTVQNHNKFLVQIPEFSSSESSEEISSITFSRQFNLNEISISPSISFICKAKYKNLNEISLGYYSKSKKLRKSIRNLIKEFLSYKNQLDKSILQNKEKEKKKEIIVHKQKSIGSSKNDSLNDCTFEIFTKTSKFFPKNHKKKIIDKKKISLAEASSGDISSSINENNNSLNIKNKNEAYDNSNNIFIFNFLEDEEKYNTNIIKLQDMNYLSISPTWKAENNSNFKDRQQNSLVIKRLKHKRCNNTEYEFEHIFDNTNNNYYNLKKSYSVNHENKNNLLKVNTNDSFYIRCKTQYLAEKKAKLKKEEQLNNNENFQENVNIEKNGINSNCSLF